MPVPHLLFNNQILPEAELRLPLTNRAFQYNDGFFETIILESGKLRFWPGHLERMQEAANVLQLTLPQLFFEEQFQHSVAELAQKDQCSALARVKLKVWRAGAGLYTPQTNTCDWLVTAQPAQPAPERPLSVGICQSVRTVPSPFSSFKGINSPVYVLASHEKSRRGLDDLLILNPEGHLAELTASNLFWVKEGILFTPSLKTSCLNGVLRRKLLCWCKENGWHLQEGFFAPEELSTADSVFSGNVTGLRALLQVEGTSLNQAPELLHQFRQALFMGSR